MGLKARLGTESASDIADFVAGIRPEHRATFDSLRQLIGKVAPQASESLKWGTLAYDLNGSLFALSANAKVVNLYILTVGHLAKYQDVIGHIPQSKCVLRFAPDLEPPLGTLRTVMKAAVAAHSR